MTTSHWERSELCPEAIGASAARLAGRIRRPLTRQGLTTEEAVVVVWWGGF